MQLDNEVKRMVLGWQFGRELRAALVSTVLAMACVFLCHNDVAWAAGKKIDYANSVPAPSFVWHGMDEDYEYEPIENVEFWQAEIEQDKDGIPYFKSRNGERYYNVSTVAFAAMDAPSSYPELNIMKLVGRRAQLSDKQRAALKWLDENAVSLPNGAITWHYNFPLNYNNIRVEEGWPSAFAQAAVIHSYILAFEITKENYWIDRAMLAAKAYLLPPGDGGLTSRVYGLPFFEEVPLTNGLSPHVLNGHLYSLYMLSKLQEYRRDAVIVNLTDAAAELTRRILLAYDMGYWTRYDLAPRFVDVPLAFEPTSHMQWPRRLKTLAVILPNGNSRLIKARPGHQDGRDVMYGPGWEGRGAEARIAKPGAFLQVMMPSEVWAEDALEKFARVKASFHGHGDVPNLAILGFREGVREYVNLPVLSATQSANKTDVVYGIGIHDLQWSSLQVYYVSWHTRLLTELWREFGGDLFYVTALRWREYLEAQEASQADTLEGVEEAIVASLGEGEISNVKSFVNEQLSVEVPQVTSRVFHPLHNPANDNEIAELLDRRDPDDLLAWDIVRKISGDCLANIDAIAARLRRLGFYTDVVDVVSGKQGNILATLLDVTVAGEQAAIMPKAGIWFQETRGGGGPL